MKIVHLCLTTVYDLSYAYQDNLLPKYQRLAGHEVCVITTPYLKYASDGAQVCCSPQKEEVSPEGVRVRRLKACLPYRLNRRFFVFSGLTSALEAENPELLFVHGLSSWTYALLFSYKRRHLQLTIVFDNHGDRFNSCRNRLSRWYTLYVCRPLLTRRMARIGKWFYGVTPGRCDFLHDCYGIPKEKIRLLAMGADDRCMESERRDAFRADIRSRYHIADDELLMVSGGRIDRSKNIHLLAQAVNASVHTKVKLLIFGSVQDDLKEEFDGLLSDRVQYAGWIPSSEVYRYFYAADMVVFPGLHSVLWEQALACQIPCVFSRLEGFEHVDLPGVRLLDFRDGTAFGLLVESFATDASARQAMAKAAESVEREHFLYSHLAQQVLEDAFEKE